MTVSLNRAYGGSVAGAVATFDAPTESALIAQGLAVASTAASTTTGAVTATGNVGQVAIAAGASSLVVTHAGVTTSSFVTAVVSQAAADGTLLRVERVVPAAGSFTIHGTANATATTLIRWALVQLGPETPIV